MLDYFEYLVVIPFRYPFLKWVLISIYALRVLGRCSEKSRPIQGHATVDTCLTSVLGHDNFIGNIPSGFYKCPMNIGC